MRALVTLIGDIRRTGVSIIWIEHVVHALLAVVDRLVVLHGGAFIGEGDSENGDPVPRGAGHLYGDARPMPETLLEVRALDAFYGDFQALFGVSLKITEGQVVAVIGANGAGKSTLLKCIAGAMKSRRDAIVFEGTAIGDQPAHAVVGRGIALVPEGRGCSFALGRGNLLIGGQLGRAGPWNLARIYGLFPVLAERRHQPSTRSRRPAADGRDRPRADEQSHGFFVRRDQPRLRAIVIREVYARLPTMSRKAASSSSSSRTSCGAQGGQPRSIPAGGRVRSSAPLHATRSPPPISERGWNGSTRQNGNSP